MEERRPSSRPRPRRSLRRRRLFLVLLLAFAALIPASARAAELRNGNEVTVRAGETVDDDLYATGAQLRIDGRVQGDATFAGSDIEVGGTVDGSVNAAAGVVEITGSVGRSVRVAAGQTTIRGQIGGDLVVAGGRVELAAGSAVGGDLIVTAGMVTVAGEVGGDIRGSTGAIELRGAVAGDVELRTGSLGVARSANIRGDLRYTSDEASAAAATARVGGETTHIRASPFGAGADPADSLVRHLLRLLWILIAGVVLILVTPRGMAAVARHGRRILTALLSGVIALWLVPLIAIVLIATVIGLPVGLLALTAWLALLWLSQVFVGHTLGRFVMPRSWDDGGRGYHLLAMTIGVVAIAALRMIPVAYVPSIIQLIVTIWGIGAATNAILNRTRRSFAGT